MLSFNPLHAYGAAYCFDIVAGACCLCILSSVSFDLVVLCCCLCIVRSLMEVLISCIDINENVFLRLENCALPKKTT